MTWQPRPALRPYAPLLGPAQPVAGPWRVAPGLPAADAAPDFAQADFDDSGWQAAALPHLDHSTAGQDTLRYRACVPGDQLAALASPGQRLLLHFEGAFYFAEAWLNGRRLGGHEGYFQPFAFDIADLVQPGPNVLAVQCRFPVEAGAFKRKTAVAGIFADWDCKPYPSLLYPNLPGPNEWSVPVGLWQPVCLRPSGPILIETLNVLPDVPEARWPAAPDEPGASAATLHISARLRNLTGEPLEARLAWEIAPHNFAGSPGPQGGLPARLEPHEALPLEFEVELPAPRLWFPWTHGEPWLYRLRARVETERDPAPAWQAAQQFGVRQVQADFGPGRWEWRLNGRRIFPKGSNYIADFYLHRVTAAGLARDLDLARGANLDMLRVHAHIAPLEFYRLCDERGLLVMCDFPLIWTYGHDLPSAEEAAFRHSVKTQAEDMIHLLASRPSIALWSMHNEPPWTPDGSFLGAEVHRAQTNFDMDNESARLALALDPSRPAVPASGLHDQHLYHGWYVGNWQDNRGLAPAFPTEFGVQALPARESPAWESLTTEWPVSADDPVWAHAGYQGLFWAGPGVGPPARFDSLGDYIEESQAYQAFYIRYVIDQWRRRKFRPTGGYLHFLFTDGWPAITWSVLDYYRVPKAGYDALAEASRPVRLCLDWAGGFDVEDGFRLVYPAGAPLRADLYLVNDDYRRAGTARVSWRIARLEEDGSPAAGLRDRLMGRLRSGALRLPLPRADEPAALARALRLRLWRVGRYELHTQVALDGQVLDESVWPFRVGQARLRARLPRRVPGWLVGKIYVAGSLQRAGDGFSFALHNAAVPVRLERLAELKVDGTAAPLAQVEVAVGGRRRAARAITPEAPLDVQTGERVTFTVRQWPLAAGPHEIELTAHVAGMGEITARTKDRLS